MTKPIRRIGKFCTLALTFIASTSLALAQATPAALNPMQSNSGASSARNRRSRSGRLRRHRKPRRLQVLHGRRTSRQSPHRQRRPRSSARQLRVRRPALPLLAVLHAEVPARALPSFRRLLGAHTPSAEPSPASPSHRSSSAGTSPAPNASHHGCREQEAFCGPTTNTQPSAAPRTTPTTMAPTRIQASGTSPRSSASACGTSSVRGARSTSAPTLSISPAPRSATKTPASTQAYNSQSATPGGSKMSIFCNRLYAGNNLLQS